MSVSASSSPPSPARSLSLLSLLARSLTEMFMGLFGSPRALFQSMTTSRGEGFAFEKLLDREEHKVVNQGQSRSIKVNQGRSRLLRGEEHKVVNQGQSRSIKGDCTCSISRTRRYPASPWRSRREPETHSEPGWAQNCSQSGARSRAETRSEPHDEHAHEHAHEHHVEGSGLQAPWSTPTW